jgi:hypothetical protein
MPSYTPIDYANAFFPHPILPKIVGQPNYERLRSMKKKLKANAASVQSDLGGGKFGHLGLVLDDVTYNALTGDSYVRPAHPGVLLIAAGTAHHESVRLREEHNENVRLFRETIDVHNALLKQIVRTIDSDYLKELNNEITSTITLTIPEILNFLFVRYGEVNHQQVVNEEEKVKNFSWNLTDPPVVIYNLIENLQTLSEAANQPKTANQLLNYGLQIVRSTGEFEYALLAWFTRPVTEHTWTNFKLHFTTAHTELSKVRGTSMRVSAFHQANATVAALSAEMSTFRDDVVESINSLTLSTQEDDTLPSTEVSSPPILDHQANATMSNQNALITAIKDLQHQIRTLAENQADKNRSNIDNGGRNTRARNGRSNDSHNIRRRTNTSMYCWTHGACAHNSRDCNSQATGHQVAATFENKMGGSTAYCGQRN